jgi:hypothetical protein
MASLDAGRTADHRYRIERMKEKEQTWTNDVGLLRRGLYIRKNGCQTGPVHLPWSSPKCFFKFFVSFRSRLELLADEYIVQI